MTEADGDPVKSEADGELWLYVCSCGGLQVVTEGAKRPHGEIRCVRQPFPSVSCDRVMVLDEDPLPGLVAYCREMIRRGMILTPEPAPRTIH